MATLFDPIKIGKIELDNRIIMAPMTRSRANDEGIQAPFAAEYYGQRGSAGLIITEATSISPMAKMYPYILERLSERKIACVLGTNDSVGSKEK
jgi:N-ethylmaleimide reductase